MNRIDTSAKGSSQTAPQAGLREISLLLSNFPSRVYSREVQMALDLILSTMAIIVAYRFRFDTGVPPLYRASMWLLVATLPIVRMLSLLLSRGYEMIWRYFSFRDAQMLSLVSLPPTILLLTIRALPVPDIFRVPIGVIGIEYFSFIFLAGAIRGLRRLTYEASRPAQQQSQDAVLIGTESSLAPAIYQLAQHPEITIAGLLTADPEMRGKLVQGVSVLGTPKDLGTILAQGSVSLVLVADATMPELSECVSTASEFGAELRLLPSASNVMQGDVRVAAKPNPDLVLAKGQIAEAQRPEVIDAFRGKTVLITGAGGSIGSEISLQVTEFPVRKIVLLDQDENSIFEIHSRLRKLENVPELVQIVGDIRNRAQMARVFGSYRPDIVLHAAAYKHVPVMEVNRCQAVLNNIVGTRELADLAIEFGAERFLMISTDKAVRPTSVMGATKRVAEILIQNRASRENCPTKFACVRFGNVVGSRGSVVPIFLHQIADGGPVTITHELMTRYFMTIPEAVQLVLQAATLATSGELYMLDMGDPMRIMDLARKLIASAGLRPDQDVEIKITGIRQGEKLHEQLWIEDANVEQTKFERVYRVISADQSPEVGVEVAELEQIASIGDEEETFSRLRNLPIQFKHEEWAQTATAAAKA